MDLDHLEGNLPEVTLVFQLFYCLVAYEVYVEMNANNSPLFIRLAKLEKCTFHTV
jgi:hypothetical protein